MSLNPGGNNYGWNYSKPDKPGYSTQLVGTVLTIQEVQKRSYTMNGQPGKPEFWEDGNPKMNIRLNMATPEGELRQFTFQPAGKEAREGRKRSVHIDLFALTGNTDMKNLIGKTICIQTQEGRYGQGNPRPWYVSLVDVGPFKLNMPLPAECEAPRVLADEAANGGQLNTPQQQYGQPQQPVQYQQPQMYQAPQQQGYGMMNSAMGQPAMRPQSMYQQPMMQPPMQQAYQPVMQQLSVHQPAQPSMQPMQPMQQQPVQQSVQQPVQQPAYPEGMNPEYAQAMAQQAFGGEVTVSYEQPAQQSDPVGSGNIYDDEDMPF